MNNFRAIALLVAGLPLVVSATAVAQEKQEKTDAQSATSVFKSRSDLVLLPVVVSDKRGKHVPGLTRENFELLENGKPQKIAIFEEEVGTTSPILRVVTNQPNAFTNDIAADARPRVLEIIALDMLNTQFTDQGNARKAMLNFLANSTHTNALMALVGIQSSGLKMIHDFTDDPAVLAAALKKVNPELPAMVASGDRSAPAANSSPSLNSPDSAAVAAESANLAEVLAQSGTGGSNILAGQLRATMRAAEANVANTRENQAALTTLESLQHLAQYFAAVPGRKSLVWATGGFPFFLNSSAPGEITGGVSSAIYQRTMQMLANANIAVYPVQVSGLEAEPITNIRVAAPLSSSITERGRALDAGGNNGDPESRQQATIATLNAIAEATGGRSYRNNNNSAELFQRATADSTSYYLLGYYLDKAGKSGWRKLKVKVNHEGVQTFHRSGFFANADKEGLAKSRQLDEQVAIASPLSYSALPILVAWQNIEGRADKKKVHFFIAIAKGEAQIDTEHGNHLSMDFIAIVRNEKGENVAQTSQSIDKNLPPEAVKQVQGDGVTYKNTLSVLPGDYTVRVVVRDNLTGRMGSLLAPLKVN